MKVAKQKEDGQNQHNRLGETMKPLHFLILAILLLYGCTAAPPTEAPQISIPLSVQCANSTAQVGVPFSSYISAQGGTGVYQFGVSGSLPYGLAVNGQLMQGMPVADTAGNYSYVVTVMDSLNQTSTATCPLQVTQRIFQCTINGQVFLARYSMEDCAKSCPSPVYCSEASSEKKKDPWGALLYVLLFIIAVVAAIFHFFPNEIGQFIKPEDFSLQKFKTPAVLSGRLYNIRTNEWEDHVSGEWGYTLGHSKRKGDEVPVSSFTHAFGLAANDKFQPFAEIISFEDTLRTALDDAKVLRGENASLREGRERYLTTDVFGLVVGLSYQYKVLGENVHSVNVQPMNRLGQKYSGNVEMPEGVPGY